MAKIPCINLPDLTLDPICIRFPGGFQLFEQINPMEGPSECQRGFNFLAQISVALGPLGPLLCILGILQAILDFFNAVKNNPIKLINPGFWINQEEPGFQLVTSFDCLITIMIPAIWILAFICDILKLIILVLRCIIDMLQGIINSLQDVIDGMILGSEFDILGDLIQIMECKQNNDAELNDQTNEALAVINGIYGIIGSLLELAGYTGNLPTSLELDSISPIDMLNRLAEADDGAAELLEIIKEVSEQIATVEGSLDTMEAGLVEIAAIIDAICNALVPCNQV